MTNSQHPENQPDRITRLKALLRPAKFEKPKMEIKVGSEARREADRQAAQKPLDRWGLIIRLLPIWLLLLIILLIEPRLPFIIVGEGIKWAGSLFDREAPPVEAAEPVFIVEGASPGTVPETQTLPSPAWNLEIAAVFMPTVHYWAADIGQWSLTYRIKPNLIATILQLESCGNPVLDPETGMLGLFQVEESIFVSSEDPFDPNTNARYALIRIGEISATVNGDPGRIFAIYHGGDDLLDVSPAEWPEETRNYQYWASGIYEEAELNLSESPTLKDWLNMGGAALCTQAGEALEQR